MTRSDLVAGLFMDSRTADDRPFVDVADLCLNLIRNLRDPLVTDAAKALGDFLISPLPRVVKGQRRRSRQTIHRRVWQECRRNRAPQRVSAYAPQSRPS